jgi:hypothetical protein
MKLIRLIPTLGLLLTVHILPVRSQEETQSSVDQMQATEESAPDSAVPPPANSCIPKQMSISELATQMNALTRAKNLARQAAEEANGGLGEYRAADSMHGPTGQAPCVDYGDGNWTFTFEGYKPGDMTTPIVKTVVKVNKETSETTVVSNTPLPEVMPQKVTP